MEVGNMRKIGQHFGNEGFFLADEKFNFVPGGTFSSSSFMHFPHVSNFPFPSSFFPRDVSNSSFDQHFYFILFSCSSNFVFFSFFFLIASVGRLLFLVLHIRDSFSYQVNQLVCLQNVSLSLLLLLPFALIRHQKKNISWNQTISLDLLRCLLINFSSHFILVVK